MRTLQLLVRDWRNTALLLGARNADRFTATRYMLVNACLFAMAWSYLVVFHADRALTDFFGLAVGITLVTLATLFGASATNSWQLTRRRTISGLGWTVLLLAGIQFVCIGLTLRQWPWVLAGVLLAGISINPVIGKFEASINRARRLQALTQPPLRNRQLGV